MIVFTIGNRKSYDRDISEGSVLKTGCRPNWDPPYEGGWVWRTKEAAESFIASNVFKFEAKVYGLKLPSGWEQDVSAEPNSLDGVHRLINDAELFLLD